MKQPKLPLKQPRLSLKKENLKLKVYKILWKSLIRLAYEKIKYNQAFLTWKLLRIKKNCRFAYNYT